MQKKCKRTLLSLILSMMLIVAMAFNITACGGNNIDKENPVGTEEQSMDGSTDVSSQEDNIDTDAQSGDTEQDAQKDDNVLGEGATAFTFTVVDGKGNEKTFEIHTDKTTVGDALLELELIAGEEGPYGLYVKSVNGITLDYNRDGMYWSFYINSEYAMTGVDVTEIKEGEVYSFKAEKS